MVMPILGSGHARDSAGVAIAHLHGARRRANEVGPVVKFAAYLALLALIVADPVRKIVPAVTGVALGMIPLTIGLLVVLLTLSRSGGPLHPGSLVTTALAIGLACLAIATIVTPWPGLGVATAGVHSYVLYVPLAWLLPRVLGRMSASQFENVTSTLLVVGAAIAATSLGSLWTALRVFQPIIESVGTHSFALQDVDLIPGAFATGERLARVCLFPFLLSASAAMLRGRQAGWPSWCCLIMSAIAIFLSGRRFAIILGVLGVGMLVFCIRRRIRFGRRVPVGLLLVACMAVFLTSDMERFSFFRSGTEDLPNRVDLAFDLGKVSITGVGAGAMTVGNGLTKEERTVAAEGQLARLNLELGLVGLTFGTAWMSSLALFSLARLRSAGRNGSPLEIACAAYVFLLLLWSLKAGVTFGEPYSLSMFWLAVGVCCWRGQGGRSHKRSIRLGDDALRTLR